MNEKKNVSGFAFFFLSFFPPLLLCAARCYSFPILLFAFSPVAFSTIQTLFMVSLKFLCLAQRMRRKKQIFKCFKMHV